MQFTSPQIGEAEQIVCSFFVTRGGVWDDNFIAGTTIPDVGKNLKGCVASLAVYAADLEKGFGKDVVITSTIRGQAEDVSMPIGVLLDDHIVGRDPFHDFWGRFIIYGACSRVWGTSVASATQVLLAMGAITQHGACTNYTHTDFTALRRLGGAGTFTVGAPMSMAGDTANWDWTNSEGAPYFDTFATTGMVGAASVSVPNASQGIVGICPKEVGFAPPDAPAAGAASRRGFITLLGTSSGRA